MSDAGREWIWSWYSGNILKRRRPSASETVLMRNFLSWERKKTLQISSWLTGSCTHQNFHPRIPARLLHWSALPMCGRSQRNRLRTSAPRVWGPASASQIFETMERVACMPQGASQPGYLHTIIIQEYPGCMKESSIIAFYLISSHLVSSHLISSHLISLSLPPISEPAIALKCKIYSKNNPHISL